MIKNAVCSELRWNTLCERFNIKTDQKTYEALIKAHAEPHRAYHTLDHIEACLTHLDRVRSETTAPEEIEMALWFHDAVYQPFSSTNEEDSASWCAQWLQSSSVEQSIIDRIRQYILDTKSHDTPLTQDGCYMLDIDLSILGTPQSVYDQFEQDVRREYRRVPSFIFCKKRKAILLNFLNRDKIYKTAYFQDTFETQARSNLKRAISNL